MTTRSPFGVHNGPRSPSTTSSSARAFLPTLREALKLRQNKRKRKNTTRSKPTVVQEKENPDAAAETDRRSDSTTKTPRISNRTEDRRTVTAPLPPRLSASASRQLRRLEQSAAARRSRASSFARNPPAHRSTRTSEASVSSTARQQDQKMSSQRPHDVDGAGPFASRPGLSAPCKAETKDSPTDVGMDCTPDDASLDLEDDDETSSDEFSPCISGQVDDRTPGAAAQRNVVDDASVRRLPTVTKDMLERARRSPVDDEKVMAAMLHKSEQKSKSRQSMVGAVVGGHDRSLSLDGSEVTMLSLEDDIEMMDASRNQAAAREGPESDKSSVSEPDNPDVQDDEMCSTESEPSDPQRQRDEMESSSSPGQASENGASGRASTFRIQEPEEDSDTGKLYVYINDEVIEHPLLPPGWTIQLSQSKQKLYYCHPDRGTTWHCPVVIPRTKKNSSEQPPTSSQHPTTEAHASSQGDGGNDSVSSDGVSDDTSDPSTGNGSPRQNSTNLVSSTTLNGTAYAQGLADILEESRLSNPDHVRPQYKPAVEETATGKASDFLEEGETVEQRETMDALYDTQALDSKSDPESPEKVCKEDLASSLCPLTVPAEVVKVAFARSSNPVDSPGFATLVEDTGLSLQYPNSTDNDRTALDPVRNSGCGDGFNENAGNQKESPLGQNMDSDRLDGGQKTNACADTDDNNFVTDLDALSPMADNEAIDANLRAAGTNGNHAGILSSSSRSSEKSSAENCMGVCGMFQHQNDSRASSTNSFEAEVESYVFGLDHDDIEISPQAKNPSPSNLRSPASHQSKSTSHGEALRLEERTNDDLGGLSPLVNEPRPGMLTSPRSPDASSVTLTGLSSKAKRNRDKLFSRKSAISSTAEPEQHFKRRRMSYRARHPPHPLCALVRLDELLRAAIAARKAKGNPKSAKRRYKTGHKEPTARRLFESRR